MGKTSFIVNTTAIACEVRNDEACGTNRGHDFVVDLAVVLFSINPQRFIASCTYGRVDDLLSQGQHLLAEPHGAESGRGNCIPTPFKINQPFGTDLEVVAITS